MSLQLVLGGSGCGKTCYLQKLITREASHFPNRQYIFLVPEQFTMQTQKELIQMSAQQGIMNIDVQSFLRLAFRVFEETGAANMPVLDDMGKTMILKKVLGNIEEHLSYFGKNVHKKGYVQEIKSFLSELYQYGVDEEKLNDMIASAGKHGALVRKLTDMKYIYKSFGEYLQEHYITSEEILTVLSNVAEESTILRDSVVCLDGFTGFTPTQYQFIEKLLQTAKNVYVSITMDGRESTVKLGTKHGLFYMSQQTICKLRRMAQDNHIEMAQDIWTDTADGERAKKQSDRLLSHTRFTQAPGIARLEKSLFRYPLQSFPEPIEDISIHVLEQPEKEVRFLAQEIRHLLLEKKCRYRDIAVVAGDLEVYGTLARDIFATCDIPCFIDQKKSVLEHPFIELLRTVCDIFLSNFKTEKVMLFTKNPFSQATEEQANLLDNFLRATGIHGYKRWCEAWQVDKVFYGLEKEKLAKLRMTIDTIRQETCDQLGELYEQIGRKHHTVREYAEALCKWMEEQQFYYKLFHLAEHFRQTNEPSLAREYEQIYDIVLSVMDRLVELLGNEVMPLKEFKEILDTGFDEARIGLIPPGVDQVVVGDLNRTRLAHIKYLFFVGMNDCNLPKAGSRGGVISDSERLFLSEQEFELAPTVRDVVYTEQFYLYLSLTKPSRHLYLTFCETGNDGKAQNPAYIIDKLQKIFPQLTIQIEENRKDNRHLLGTDSGIDYLIKGLRNQNYIETGWQEIFSFHLRHEGKRQFVEDLIDASFYREEQTNLSRQAVRGLYKEILTGSTSQFERYAACAFSYYLQYGLHLQERPEHQVEYFDIGNIVHQALERYTRKLIEEGKGWEDIEENEQHRRAEECIEETAALYKNGLLYNSERDSRLIFRLQRILNRTIWAITRQMQMGKFRTVDSEFTFEMKNELLRLIGRIDRVDSLEEGDTSYVKVVDYKTGQKTISLSDLYYGLQMQLMVYLKACVEDRTKNTGKNVIPAGVLYYHIDDPMLEGKDHKENLEQKLLSNLRMDGLVNEDDPVLPSLDSSFETGNGGLATDTASYIIPAATDKKGQLKKTSKAVTTEDFERLMSFTGNKLGELRKEIMSGNISVNPYIKNDASGESACQYCPYHSICRFDTRLEGNRYRVLNKLTDDEVMYNISQDMKKTEPENTTDKAAEKGEAHE